MTSHTQERVGEILLYQTADGATRIDVRLENETVWLSQAQMAELFEKDVRTISEHISNVFEDGELNPDATIRKFRSVQVEGRRHVTRDISQYNLDVIISVGYRVKSLRGTQFRIWATKQLREYLIKGFVLDDQRFKKAGEHSYFDELLSRIRDIRSSEKIFWRKVLDIYATSIDYTPNTEASQQFFKTVQNKMHWAVHGKTAAEIIASRADSTKPNMGLTSWMGNKPERTDIEIAKNYLSEDELDTLNRLVSMYLDFAELQAKNRKPTHMKDWIAKLDDFIRLSDRELLSHAGKIKHAQAIEKAHQEYDKFYVSMIEEPSLVEQHFMAAVEVVNQLESERKS